LHEAAALANTCRLWRERIIEVLASRPRSVDRAFVIAVKVCDLSAIEKLVMRQGPPLVSSCAVGWGLRHAANPFAYPPAYGAAIIERIVRGRIPIPQWHLKEALAQSLFPSLDHCLMQRNPTEGMERADELLRAPLPSLPEAVIECVTYTSGRFSEGGFCRLYLLLSNCLIPPQIAGEALVRLAEHARGFGDSKVDTVAAFVLPRLHSSYIHAAREAVRNNYIGRVWSDKWYPSLRFLEKLTIIRLS
jgi:hypothetical protein